MSRRLVPRWTVVVPWLALVALALVFRLSLVAEFRASAGDGIHYHQLAQQLRHAHRFAYGPPPQPLTWTRSPGYPAFLAMLSPSTPVDLPQHLVIATRANAVLDVGTAGLVAVMAWLLGMGRLAQVCGFAATIFMPPLFMLASHGLCESLTTWLLTLACCSALATRRAARPFFFALLAGISLGLALWVRLDSVLALPALLVVLWMAGRTIKHRLRWVLACFALSMMVYSPWPLRSLLTFGELHLGPSPWIDTQGVPLRLGMMRWAQTWATGRIDGENYCLFVAANHGQLPPTRPNIILPTMYDDDAERQALFDLFNRYCREGESPDVDRGFYALAAERLRKHPFRTLVILPLYRIRTLWSPMPSYELSLRSRLLRLPTQRPFWDNVCSALLLLSGFGACIALLEPGKRRWAAALLLIPLVRSLVFAFLLPIPLQRYFVEAIPVLLLFSGYALAWPLVRLHDLLPKPLYRLWGQRPGGSMGPASSGEIAPRSDSDAF